MGFHRHRWFVAAMAAALLLTAPHAGAASLQVAPTSLTLQARQNADGLWLSNTGAEPLHAQVRVFRWTQRNNEDILEPASDLAISPPMLQLAPGAQQLVRVVRLGAPPADNEAAYRVIVDELPVGSTATEAKSGLQFVLRYSVPVFLVPAAGEISPVLLAKVAVEGEQRFIEIANSGRQHAQIADLVFVDKAGGRHAIAEGLAGYALPGQSKRWPLPGNLSTPANGTFKARINGEPVEQSLPLDSAPR